MMDRVLNLHNQVLSGKVLTSKQVEEIGKIADVVYKAAEEGQTKRYDQFRGMAKDYGFNLDRAVPDYRPKSNQGASNVFDKMPPAAQYKGKRMRDTETGKFFVSDGMTWKPE